MAVPRVPTSSELTTTDKCSNKRTHDEEDTQQAKEHHNLDVVAVVLGTPSVLLIVL
jgi:hypothetical protein